MRSREFQIFAKPVGAECNLRCTYCYYLGKKTLYPHGESILMSDDLLENYIIQHFQASSDKIINFSWHGGEPMLAGIDFYKKVIRFQNKHCPAGTVVKNGIQTNGTLLNNEWCRFLASENFIVGISIDGPGDFHNANRRTQTKGATLQIVIRGFELLKNYGVSPEILCVVNAENVRSPLVLYSFFRKLGAKYITFLPLVEHRTDLETVVSKNSVPPLEFGSFLCSVFDEWIRKDIGEIKVQIFEEAARTAFNQDHTLCIFRKNCGGVPVVEHTGDFYSCDHFVDNDHFIGNIRNTSLADLLDCTKQTSFGNAKSNTLPQYCIGCDVLQMCNGECPKNRFINTPDGEPGLNYLCSGYKLFFHHCQPFIEAISLAWKNQTGI